MAKIKKIKPIKKRCDDLWAEIIKKRAGYKSEYSRCSGKQIGGDYILNAHHILGKCNFALRYSLDNGICLTSGEHKFIAHSSSKAYEIYDFVGQARMDELKFLKTLTAKADYKMKEIELKQILKTLKEK